MSRSIIETLESRTLLAAVPVAAIAQRSLQFNAVQGTENTQILRISNTGTANLDLVPGSVNVLGSAKGKFTTNFPSDTGFSIKPGKRFDMEVTFAAQDGAVVVDVARISIVTTDPAARGFTIALRGLPTLGEGVDKEPSLQRVIDTFGLPIDVGDADPSDYLLGTPTSTSDEVVMQALQKSGTGAVIIRPLALFGVSSGPAVRVGYYSPGQTQSAKELWYVPVESAQSVNPIVYGQTVFDPGASPFALFTQWPGFYNADGTTRNVYSEDTLNSSWETNSSKLRKTRFYPFVDQFGNTVENAYVVAVEEYTAAYDNQDVVFIITNVKPADAKPTIAATSVFQQPDNTRLVFNKVEIPDEFVPNVTRLTQTVKVRNTGTENLLATFATTGNFSITSGGGSGITIAPGATRNVVITFTASSGNVHNGTFTINSNDTANPTITYDLAGYWQQYSEYLPTNHGASEEPTSKKIVNDLFGYTTVLANDGQNLSTAGEVRATGDEILQPYWKIADDGAYVRVTQLAAFHNQTYLDVNLVPQATQAYIGWYEQGSPNSTHTLATHASGDGQTVFPREKNNTSGITSGAFKPGTATFGFVVEGNEYSDPTLNPDSLSRTGYGHFVRFWPAYDKQGKLIANSYIMLQDYNRDFTNYDFNDNIYLIENIKPVDAIKSVLTVFTEETSKGARISFTSPATGPKIVGFNVYRSTTARGGYALLNDTPLARRPVTTYIDETSIASDTFYYQITAIGANGSESQPVTVVI